MSGQAPSKKAEPKNPYGLPKIERIAREKAARREAHEADAISHDRNTKLSRAAYAHLTTRTARLEGYQVNANKEIADLLAKVDELREKKVAWEAERVKDEEKFGVAAEQGKKDAEISAKYAAYLALESDELDL